MSCKKIGTLFWRRCRGSLARACGRRSEASTSSSSTVQARRLRIESRAELGPHLCRMLLQNGMLLRGEIIRFDLILGTDGLASQCNAMHGVALAMATGSDQNRKPGASRQGSSSGRQPLILTSDAAALLTGLAKTSSSSALMSACVRAVPSSLPLILDLDRTAMLFVCHSLALPLCLSASTLPCKNRT